MSAVLLVFQYGQPRIFFAMGRDGLLPQWAAKLNPKTRIPSTTTIITGVFVAAWALIGDAAETYDLTNIGTLFAFMLVSIGVLVLRYTEPDRPRPFKVRFVWAVCLLSAAGCLSSCTGCRDRRGSVSALARDRPRAVLLVRVQPQQAAPARVTSFSERKAELARSSTRKLALASCCLRLGFAFHRFGESCDRLTACACST